MSSTPFETGGLREKLGANDGDGGDEELGRSVTVGGSSGGDEASGKTPPYACTRGRTGRVCFVSGRLNGLRVGAVIAPRRVGGGGGDSFGSDGRGVTRRVVCRVGLPVDAGVVERRCGLLTSSDTCAR